jgi:hypothetical protein
MGAHDRFRNPGLPIMIGREELAAAIMLTAPLHALASRIERDGSPSHRATIARVITCLRDDPALAAALGVTGTPASRQVASDPDAFTAVPLPGMGRALVVVPLPADARMVFRIAAMVAARWEVEHPGRKMATEHMETRSTEFGKALVVWDDPVLEVAPEHAACRTRTDGEQAAVDGRPG